VRAVADVEFGGGGEEVPYYVFRAEAVSVLWVWVLERGGRLVCWEQEGKVGREGHRETGT
jgi:hypothetical protein